jgi:hypothetical protein
MLGQLRNRLLRSQAGSQPHHLRPAAASSGLRRLLPLCRSSSSSSASSEGSRRRTRQPRSRSKGAPSQVPVDAAPERLPAPDAATNAAAPPPPLDAANSAAADAATAAAAARSLSELVPVPSGSGLDFPDAPFKLRPYQVRPRKHIHKLQKHPQLCALVRRATGLHGGCSPYRSWTLHPTIDITACVWLCLLQVDAIRSIISSWKGGNNAQMVMLPTGCGKTVVFSGELVSKSTHTVLASTCLLPAACRPSHTLPGAGS